MRREALTAVAVLATLPFTQHATVKIVPCRPGKSRCGWAPVPLDRKAETGRGRLWMQRVKASDPHAGTLIVLPGGPGQSASATRNELLQKLGRHIRKHWDIAIFDPRGTGNSHVALCPLLQNDLTLRSTRAANQCASILAATRSQATTWNNVQDLEAVRVRLGIDRMALYGTSYGTRVAMGYAAAYPRHVDRLVLDSVVAPDGPSTAPLQSFAAMRRILKSLCPKRCHGVTRDLVTETAQLVARLRAQPMRGTVYDARGGSQSASIDALGLLDLIQATDLLKPAIRGGLAAAITSARRGDPAALLRLAAFAKPWKPPSIKVFSAGTYAATTCAELRAPWDPAAGFREHLASIAAQFNAIDDARFTPFDRQTALQGGLVPLCLKWAPTPKPPVVPWRPILAPTLILAGTHDIRAPLENLREILPHLPTASVLTVPAAGHSVFGPDIPAVGEDPAADCARRAVRGFLLRVPRPTRCPRVKLPTPGGLPPMDFADLRPVPQVGGRTGRTLRAVELTLDDLAFALAISPSGGGLRGGWYVRADGRLLLRSVEYVPGVRVSTRRDNGRRLLLHVSGHRVSRGTLALDQDGHVSGRLGAQRVSTRLKIRIDNLRRPPNAPFKAFPKQIRRAPARSS